MAPGLEVPEPSVAKPPCRCPPQGSAGSACNETWCSVRSHWVSGSGVFLSCSGIPRLARQAPGGSGQSSGHAFPAFRPGVRLHWTLSREDTQLLSYYLWLWAPVARQVPALMSLWGHGGQVLSGGASGLLRWGLEEDQRLKECGTLLLGPCAFKMHSRCGPPLHPASATLHKSQMPTVCVHTWLACRAYTPTLFAGTSTHQRAWRWQEGARPASRVRRRDQNNLVTRRPPPWRRARRAGLPRPVRLWTLQILLILSSVSRNLSTLRTRLLSSKAARLVCWSTWKREGEVTSGGHLGMKRDQERGPGL